MRLAQPGDEHPSRIEQMRKQRKSLAFIIATYAFRMSVENMAAVDLVLLSNRPIALLKAQFASTTYERNDRLLSRWNPQGLRCR